MVMITDSATTVVLDGIRRTYYRCEDCGSYFEAGAPWDLYCEICWDAQQTEMVNELAIRENA